MRAPLSAVAAAAAVVLFGVAGSALAPAMATAPPAKGHSETTTAPRARHDSYHGTTALVDGRVLVAGGDEPAEVFDPAAGTWTPTGPMAVKRAALTATRLADGKVLVVGGAGDGDAGSLASAELFDPATATWAPTGSLAFTRFFHTATLLADGTVLVAGGLEAGHGPFRREAEVFDPTSGTWSSAGAMELGRAFHTATLLDDGKVLVAGGQGETHGKSLADAVVYDPTSRIWAAVPRLMSDPRAQHSATLLPDNTVLLAGGTRQRQGQGPADVLSSAEIYDRKAASFRPAPSLGRPRVSHTATLLPDGRVYVLGGAGTADSSGTDEAASAEMFDPSAARWLPTAPVTAAPRLHGATLLGPKGCGTNCGKVLVVSPTSAQLFTPGESAGTPAKSPGDSPNQGGSGSAVLPLALVLVAAVAAVVVLRRRRFTGRSP